MFGITDWHRDGTLAEHTAVEARNLAPLPGDVDFTVGASLPISGRAADRQAALDFGANDFLDLDLDLDDLTDIGGVDLVFDVIGGDVQRRSASVIRPGGTLVSVVGPVETRPADGLAIDFVVESVPSQLVEIVDRVRDGRLRLNRRQPSQHVQAGRAHADEPDPHPDRVQRAWRAVGEHRLDGFIPRGNPMINLFSPTRSSRCRSAAVATAGAVTFLSALPFAQPAHAASGFQRAAYFVGADGSLDVFGSNSDGVWSKAAPVTPAKSAPAGAPVAAVRGPSGRLLAYYVGGDGAVYESCGAVRGSAAAVTGSGFAPAGSPVSATLVGRQVHLTVESSGGFSSAADDDPPMCGTGVHWWGPGPHPKWWTVGGDFATVGYADGEVGVFQAGSDGAVHALWGTAAGQWQEATLTGTGVAAPGAGLGATASSAAGAGIRGAAVSPNATAPTPGATSIFYAGRDGHINVEHPATNGLSDNPVALPGDPEPQPWKSHIGALSAADGTTQVAYISSTGALFVAGTVNGQWQVPKQVSGTGFGTAGASVGVVGSAADDLDIIYCGTPPGHIHIGPGGPVYTQPALGSVVAGTITAAAQ